MGSGDRSEGEEGVGSDSSPEAVPSPFFVNESSLAALADPAESPAAS